MRRLVLSAATALTCVALLAGCGQRPHSTNPAFTPVAPVNPCGNNICGGPVSPVTYPSKSSGSTGTSGASGTTGATGTTGSSGSGMGHSGTTGSSGS